MASALTIQKSGGDAGCNTPPTLAENVYGLVCDVRTAVDSHGCGGSQHTEFPPLAFENELEQVTALRPRAAERMLNLIHQKNAANAKVAGSLEYVDLDDALDEFRNEGAKLFCSAVEIYENLARSLRWSSDAFSDHEKGAMIAEQERAAAREASRLANAEF